MEFKGKYSISAMPEAVWAALHNAEMLGAAIPNCEAVEKLSETEFKARAGIKVGPVKTIFEGSVQLREVPPSDGAVRALILKGDGQGGAAGYARGESHVQLYPQGAGTLVSYDARATFGGRLAQVGQAATVCAAKALADEFFDRFANLMRGDAAAPGAPHPSKRPHAGPAKEEALAPQVWVAGVIGIIVILLIVFSIVL